MILRIPLFDRNKDQSKRGRKAEKSAAKRLGGSLTPASGALPGAKGDIRTDEFLIESKSTVKASMVLRRAWLEKIRHEARQDHKYPALLIQFTELDGKKAAGGPWVAIPEYVFSELLKKNK